MRSSLAAELLSTFSPAETRNFLAFLARPERRVRPEVMALARTCLSPKGAPTASGQRANQVASWLYTEARAFLLERHYAGGSEVPLLREFDRRGLVHHRDRLLRRLRKADAGGDLELERAVYDTVHRGSRAADINLQRINDLLDDGFIRQKLRQGCLMASHRTVANVDYDDGLFPLVITYLETRPDRIDEHAAIYLNAYYFLLDPGAEDHFVRFRKLLSRMPPSVSAGERRDCYLLGINYCIRRVNRGELHRASEALDLYRAGLADGSLLEDGHLTASTYRNALALSLRSGDFAWGEAFTEAYAPRLPAAIRANLYRYNRARLAYARNQPEDALNELRSVRSDNVLFTLTLDTFRAKIYYETGAHDLLSAHLDKMTVFLRRKDTSYHHRNYANFIALLRKTLHLRPRPEDAEALRGAIAAEPVLTEKAWLLGLLRN